MKETYKHYEVEVRAQNNRETWMVIIAFRPPIVGVHTIQMFGDYKTEGAAETAGFELARDRIDKYSP